MSFNISSKLISEKNSKSRTIILYGGSIALASGIWAMHFVGMLAYDMKMLIHYNLPLTIASYLIALIFSFYVFKIIESQNLVFFNILKSSLLLGIGISLMHYIGMTAMEMDADIYYQPLPFALSILIAIFASMVALFLLHKLPKIQSKNAKRIAIFFSSLVMGMAICGMHYMGMDAQYLYLGRIAAMHHFKTIQR